MAPDPARPYTQLIITADDFGSSPEVNEAIRRCATLGIVTSTSVMVNMPYADEDVKNLQTVCPNLSIGLHLNLTSGRPLSAPGEIPSLVDRDGNFFDGSAFERGLLSGRVDRRHLQREIDAQLAALQERVERITHVDSHKHIHRYPPVLAVLLSTGQHRGVTKVRTNHRRYISSTVTAVAGWQNLGRHLLRSPASIPGIGLKLMQQWFIRKYAFTSPDALVTPIPRIPPGGDVTNALDAWARTFTRLPGGIFEANFHPGGVAGEEELLCHPRLREQLGDVRLIGYRDLKN
ncbi:MAG: ChbG/HpnK family deacetylase [Caldilineaceae bacterium]|nr:ChbG/HpnK family deacetylase [Caldilineaceae bacterium]